MPTESAEQLAGRATGETGDVFRDLARSAALLIVDDEAGMRNFLKKSLESHFALLEVAESVEEAEALRRRCHFDMMVVDVRLPGHSGIDWLREVREQGSRTDVIFITAYADMETAIAALRAGASDLLLKPFRVEQMIGALRRCLERRRMARENFLLQRRVDVLAPMEGIIGNSAAMQELSAIVRRVAPTGSTVLLQGETGTGKELIARAIHLESGRRGDFVPVNCGSISPELLESELFGHLRGAFTGAQSSREGLFSYADNGTLFLDEIGEMPLPMQAKLLRALEQRTIRPVGSDVELPVDARIVAATNRELSSAVEQGRFRRDLYYRLEVLTLRVPALRERLEDIPPLAEHFVHTLSAELGVPPVPLGHQDYVQLQSYGWPGNVRELKNVIERSLLLGKLPRDCFPGEGRAPSLGGGEPHGVPAAALDWPLAEVEKHHILRVLEAVKGNKSEAARRLGVSRKTLERKTTEWARESGQ